MSDIINLDEIKSITSNTPITITFNDGSTITAYSVYFKDLTRYTSHESDDYKVTLEVEE